ncbi:MULTISPECIES: helix-turn-helix domain-containing protein [unclassified Xanthobacter]|uniref:helix-turn-helix domain-containing protein n=1 Tax=unclassified Xanthobacter TaxID=2623496 RepID=UPI001EDD071F|nr:MULTISPECIES: helix-turn-helix transcriptional regulator [unclassified Xanthobacter]
MSMDAEAKIGERLRIVAKRFGGIGALADATGTARRTVGNYLDGTHEPKISFLLAVSGLTGASLDWLITGREPAAFEEPVEPTVAATPATIDTEFMGQVGELVEILYRQEGARPSARELVQVSGRLYGEAYRISADAAERLGAVKLLIEQERAVLRAAAANPAKSKSSA